MIEITRAFRPLLLAGVAAWLTGCAVGGGTGQTSSEGSFNDPASDGAASTDAPDSASEPLAEFSLQDVNPRSPRYGAPVSPRDYLGRISAWYFGHAT